MSHTLRIFAADDELTNSQVCELYLQETKLRCQAGLIKPRTYDRCEFYLRSFCDHEIDGERLGDRRAGTGRVADLTAWLVANPGWKATQTKQTACGVVVCCFAWASEEGLCQLVYRRPRYLGPPSRPRPAMTLGQYKDLRAAARADFKSKHGGRVQQRGRVQLAFRAALVFLFRTGCRTSEMREIRWKHVDWENGVVRLEQHKTERVGDVRQIPVRRVMRMLRWLHGRRRGQLAADAGALAERLPAVLREQGKSLFWLAKATGIWLFHLQSIVRRARRVRDDHVARIAKALGVAEAELSGDGAGVAEAMAEEHVFVNTLGKPWSAGVFAKWFRKFADLAGIPLEVSAYSLRHGLAVRLIEAGVNDRAIADVLGHATTKYVSWYGRTTRFRSEHLNDVLGRDRQQPR